MMRLLRICIGRSRLTLTYAGRCVAVLVAMAVAGSAWAQIEVTGRGEASAPPAEATVLIRVTGTGPLAEDANVKFNDAKKQALEALKGTEIPDMTIAEKGTDMAVTTNEQQMMQMMNGMVDESTPMQMDVTITEQLECTLAGLDKLEGTEVADRLIKLIDTARNANLQIGAAPVTNMYAYQMSMMRADDQANAMLLFKPADGEALRKQAYKKAIEDARTRATELAALAEVKLGRIQSIAVVSGNNAASWTPWGMQSDGTDPEAVSGTLTDITMTVDIHVTFAVE
jgi:uncharacterized protein YggE